MTESKSLVDGYLWIQKWSACRSKLCYLSERQRFPLMAFCSYNIFLKIATSFFHGSISRQSCSGLLLKVFEKGPQWSWAYLWGTFLLPWGLFSLPVRTGVLGAQPSPNPPEKGAGDTRGLLLSGISSSQKGLLLPAPPGRFLSFAAWKKLGTVHSKIVYTPYKNKIQQNPKILDSINTVRNSKSFCWIGFI